MRIEHTRIILTGAASGIGLAVLGTLNTYPCHVIAVDRNEEGLRAALAALPQGPASITPYACDLSQPAAIDGLFEYATTTLGSIDLFIANAGFAYYESLEQAAWDRLEAIYRVNTIGPIYSAVKMRELNGTRPYRVVITASAMGKLAIPGYAVYGATKAALDRFAEGYRLELDDPRKLALVYPIGTRTQFFAAASSASTPQPWPTQTPEAVARAIIRGIERDQQSIYPSTLFRLILLLDRVFPPVRWLEQAIEKRRFERWRSRQSKG